MATSRIKEKISALVSNQLPEFVQSDFPTFVAFIEAYYRFLEQDQSASELLQNARSYNDIDRTTDSFVQYFLDTYAKNTPKNLLIDDRFLVKKIKDLYEAKGSELSFKLLFRTLFNTTVDVNVPYENVLIASGGKWQQNFSIRVTTVSGDRNDLANRIITHTAGGVVFRTPIVRTKILTSTLTEIFLDSSLLSSSYTIGDTVRVFEGSTLIFSGTISPTTVSYSVSQPGAGFKVGQIFTINYEGGVGTIVKVTGITSGGGVSKLKILNYGYNYSSPENFIVVTLDSTKSVSESVSFLLSRTQGFGSSGQVLLGGPSNPGDYFLEDYVDSFIYTIPTIAATFNNDVFNPTVDQEQSVPSSLAIVRFNLGGLAAYPGSYSTDQSFVSEFEVRLQDDELYQPFAYQTVTDVDISDFVDIVKKLLNPAGQVLYNNRTLSANIDLSAELIVTPISNVFFEAHDSFDVSDLNSLNIRKTISDQTGIFELKSLEISKTFSDNNITFSDTTPLSIQLQYNDNVTISDITSLEKNVFKDSVPNVQDSYASLFTKAINNTANTSDNGIVSITSSTYSFEDYFGETYVLDEPTTFNF